MPIIRFIYQVVLFLLPILLLVAGYFVIDPFRVVREYDSYYTSGQVEGVALTAGHVSAMMYKQNHKSYNYDSFILGSSRSVFYEVNDWKKHIGADASCFHFDASGESLYGIWRKLKYINESGNKIRNVLMVLDYYTLRQLEPADEHVYIIHPMLEENGNYFKYHTMFFKAFFDDEFLSAYIDYRLYGVIRPVNGKDYLSNERYKYDSPTNERRVDSVENKIAIGEYYNRELKAWFDGMQYPDLVYEAAIGEKHREMLCDIKKIFDNHNTCFKIVISPLYNQIKLAPNDINSLKGVFGDSCIYDFSGVNKFTCDYQNYYEPSHYRPHVAREIMTMIYNK